MKKLIIAILLGLGLVMTGCVTPDVKETVSLEKVYENSISLRNKTIPLPKGKWKVIGSGYQKDDAYFEVVLMKEIDEKQIDSFALIVTNSKHNKYNRYYPSKYCKRIDVHHVVVKNNKHRGTQDCWLINHYRMYVKPSRPALKEAYEYLTSNKYTLPKIMINSYHRFTGRYVNSKYLEVYYYFNPEVEGFEPPTITEWSTTSWNPLQINKYPKKVAYIERMKKECAILHDQIRDGFGK